MKASLVAALGSLVALVGCQSDPTTTMLRVPRDERAISLNVRIDPRTGALAMREMNASPEVTSFRRMENERYVTLAPPLEFVRIQRWAWHDGGAFADEGTEIHRFAPETGWEEMSTDDCEPGAQTNLADAPAMDDAWFLARASSFEPATTLCHFDGASFTPVEVVDGLRQLVAFDGRLFAIVGVLVVDFEVQVRSRDGGTWTRVEGLPEGENLRSGELVVRTDGVFLGTNPGGSELNAHWWRIDGASPEELAGIPGFEGDQWRIEREGPPAEMHCIDIRDFHSCWSSVDWLAIRVLRVEGEAPVEAGYLRVDEPGDSGPLDVRIVGPGQLMLGSDWINDPALAR